MTDRYEDGESEDWREAATGGGREEEILPGIVERGREIDTIKRHPKFPGAQESEWGSRAMEDRHSGVTREQTAEEIDDDTPQPAPTGHDVAEDSGHTSPGKAPQPTGE